MKCQEATYRVDCTVWGLACRAGSIDRDDTHLSSSFILTIFSPATRKDIPLTLSLLTSYIYEARCKARNFNVVYIWTYILQRWKPSLSIFCKMFQHWINAESFPVSQLCVNILPVTKITIITNGIEFGSQRINSALTRIFCIFTTHFLNLLKPTGYGMHQQVEHFNNCTLCPHCIYVFGVCLRTSSDLCHLHLKNWLIFITKMKSVYSAVRTGLLNEAFCAPSFKV
jgi:hypothetical protein